MNLGLPQLPEWLIKIIVALALFGLIMSLASAVGVCVYCVQHLHWK